MQAKPEAVSVQILSHKHFRLGVLAPDARHVEAAGLFGMNIGHACSNAKQLLIVQKSVIATHIGYLAV